jgi:hypothetical protein
MQARIVGGGSARVALDVEGEPGAGRLDPSLTRAAARG